MSVAKTIVRVYDDIFSGQLHIIILKYEGGKGYTAEPVEIKWREIVPGELSRDAWLSFGEAEGKEFIRQIAAHNQFSEPGADLRAHLQDMRKLVGKYAGVGL